MKKWKMLLREHIAVYGRHGIAVVKGLYQASRTPDIALWPRLFHDHWPGRTGRSIVQWYRMTDHVAASVESSFRVRRLPAADSNRLLPRIREVPAKTSQREEKRSSHNRYYYYYQGTHWVTLSQIVRGALYNMLSVKCQEMIPGKVYF